MLEKKVYLYYLSSVFITNRVVVIFVAVLEELRRYDKFCVESSSYFGLSRLHILG